MIIQSLLSKRGIASDDIEPHSRSKLSRRHPGIEPPTLYRGNLVRSFGASNLYGALVWIRIGKSSGCTTRESVRIALLEATSVSETQSLASSVELKAQAYLGRWCLISRTASCKLCSFPVPRCLPHVKLQTKATPIKKWKKWSDAECAVDWAGHMATLANAVQAKHFRLHFCRSTVLQRLFAWKDSCLISRNVGLMLALMPISFLVIPRAF